MSQTRDIEGTKAFFAQVSELHYYQLDKVATDRLVSSPRAIEEELGEYVEREVRPCTANPVSGTCKITI